MSKRIRWAVWIALLITSAAAVLAITLLTNRVPPYRYVDQVARDASLWQGKAVSIHGIVSEP